MKHQWALVACEICGLETTQAGATVVDMQVEAKVATNSHTEMPAHSTTTTELAERVAQSTNIFNPMASDKF